MKRQLFKTLAAGLLALVISFVVVPVAVLADGGATLDLSTFDLTAEVTGGTHFNFDPDATWYHEVEPNIPRAGANPQQVSLLNRRVFNIEPGQSVTVNGTLATQGSGLIFIIPPDSTVIWNAVWNQTGTLTGATLPPDASDAVNYMIVVDGGGTFTVASGGMLSTDVINLGAVASQGSAVVVNGTVAATGGSNIAVQAFNTGGSITVNAGGIVRGGGNWGSAIITSFHGTAAVNEGAVVELVGTTNIDSRLIGTLRLGTATIYGGTLTVPGAGAALIPLLGGSITVYGGNITGLVETWGTLVPADDPYVALGPPRLVVGDDVTITGDIDIMDNAELHIEAEATLTATGTTRIRDNGDVNIAENASLLTTTVNNAGAIYNNGTIEGEITNSASGDITNAGTIDGNITVTGGTFNNEGTVDGNINITGGTFDNEGTVDGNINVTGGTFDNNGMVVGSVTDGGVTTHSVSVVNLTTPTAMAAEGATVQVTFDPPSNAGAFARWETTPVLVMAPVSEGVYSFVMPNEPVSVTAVFNVIPPTGIPGVTGFAVAGMSFAIAAGALWFVLLRRKVNKQEI